MLRVLSYFLDNFGELVEVFLFEKDISFFYVFSGIPVLVILCRIGKRYDDFLHAEYIDLSKCGSTSTSDGNLCISEKRGDIFLGYPVQCLGIFHVFEIFFHSFIEFSQCDDPFIGIVILKASKNFSENHLRALTSTDNENMGFGSFPMYEVFVIAKYEAIQCISIFPGLLRGLAMTGKYRVEYLSCDFCFFFLKIFLRTFETKKYSSC